MKLSGPKPSQATPQAAPVAEKASLRSMNQQASSATPRSPELQPASAAKAPVRAMTYGDGQAIKILAADRLGMNPSCLEDARQLLEGKAIHPMVGAEIDREATRIHNAIASEPTLVEQANTHTRAIAAECGFVEKQRQAPLRVGDVVAIRGDLRKRMDGTCQYTADQLVDGKYVKHAGHGGTWTGRVEQLNGEEALVGGAWRHVSAYELMTRGANPPQGENP